MLGRVGQTSLPKSDSNMAYNKDYYKEWYLKNREKKLAYLKKWKKENKDKVKEYIKTSRAKNPEKIKARERIKYLIKTGKLKRGTCKECGETNAEAHHYDYSKQKNIIWLCTYHHKVLHNLIIIK